MFNLCLSAESKFSKAEVTPRFPAVINSTSGGANVSLSRSTSHGEDAVKGNNLFAAPTHLQELQTLSLSADGERNFSGELAQTADSKHFANGARNGQGGDTAAVGDTEFCLPTSLDVFRLSKGVFSDCFEW